MERREFAEKILAKLKEEKVKKLESKEKEDVQIIEEYIELYENYKDSDT